MRRPNVRRQSVVWVAVVVVVILAAVILGLLDGPELSSVNLAFRLRGPRPLASPVVIVAIDDQSFAVNHDVQWPWPRTYFAQLLDRLAAAGARTIVLDVSFFEPEPPGEPATYTIRGDSLIGIADRFGVTVQDIVAANGPDFDGRLCAGQSLAIPTRPPVSYTVQLDSIADVADRFQVDPNALMRYNRIDDPCDVVAAQLLLVPVIGPIAYPAQAGDSPAGVAARFNVNPLAVVDADGRPIGDRSLRAGETVYVQLGDQALAASIRAAGNVVLIGAISVANPAGGRLEKLSLPIRPLREAQAGFGLANIQPDVDGVVHSVPAWDTALDQVYYAWPLAAAAVFAGRPLDTRPANDSLRFGEQGVPLQSRYLLINFRGPEATLPTYSAVSVVNGDLPLALFADRIVLVGATSELLKDTFPAPFDPHDAMPAVEIMGNAIDTVLSGEFVNDYSGICPLPGGCPLGARLPSLIAVLVAGAAALALTRIRRPGLGAAALLGLMALYALLWLAAFAGLRTRIPFVAPELALFVGFALPTIERAVSEELEKRRVRGIFEHFISPAMVEELIDSGIEASRGRRAELTILFSDIRGFTALSERMTPEDVAALLNEYLDVMSEVILRHGGTIDKFEGDLIMAFFGAPIPHPDHALRALSAAIDMRVALGRLGAKWAAAARSAHFEMGIGLNTGEVFVGLIGSSRRVNYTVIGDAVNLASRIQDLTKELRWPLLISEFTYAQVKHACEAEFAELHQVRGRSVPVGIYKVLGRKDAPEDERVRPLYS